MRKSGAMLKRVKNQAMWSCGFWFLLGFAIGLGDHFGFYKAAKADFQFWLQFGLFAVLSAFIVECMEVVLQRIEEVDSKASNALPSD